MTDHTHDPIMEEEIHYCEKHPDRDTELRCNRCNRYMCIKCAVRTPVGYTCSECVRGHEEKFFNSTQIDYVIVGTIAALGSAMGAAISAFLGIFFTFIIAATVGGVIGRLALFATSRRRGRYSGYVCAGGVVVGTIIVGFFFRTPAVLLYLILATSAAYASFKVSI